MRVVLFTYATSIRLFFSLSLLVSISSCAIELTETSLTIGPSARMQNGSFSNQTGGNYVSAYATSQRTASAKSPSQLQNEIKLLNAQLGEATKKLISARRSKQWACDEKLYDSRTSGYLTLNYHKCKPYKKSYREAERKTQQLRNEISIREGALKQLGWAQFPDGSFRRLAVNGEAQNERLSSRLLALQKERAKLLAEERSLDREIRALGNKRK